VEGGGQRNLLADLDGVVGDGRVGLGCLLGVLAGDGQHRLGAGSSLGGGLVGLDGCGGDVRIGHGGGDLRHNVWWERL